MQGRFPHACSSLPGQTLGASGRHRTLDGALGFVSGEAQGRDLHRESDGGSPPAPLSPEPLRAPVTLPVLAASAGLQAPPTGTFLTDAPGALPNASGAARRRADGVPLHFFVRPARHAPGRPPLAPEQKPKREARVVESSSSTVWRSPAFPPTARA